MENEENLKNKNSPFKSLNISDHSFLSSIESRSQCRICHRSRKFFCYSCYVLMEELENSNKIHQVKLPIKVDIIKHKKEVDGKSTAIHAKLLANEDVTIYDYPDIPDYSNEKDIYLLFPSVKSITVSSLFQGCSSYTMKPLKGHNLGTLLKKKLEDVVVDEDIHNLQAPSTYFEYTSDNLPIKKVVLIDSTWNQCRGIYKDVRMQSMKSLIIQNRPTYFWRTQVDCPRFYLSTIEAIHQLLMEIHISAWGIDSQYMDCLKSLELNTDFIPESKIIKTTESVGGDSQELPYNGQYDNILFFFSYMYEFINERYDHSSLLSYKKPF